MMVYFFFARLFGPVTLVTVMLLCRTIGRKVVGAKVVGRKVIGRKVIGELSVGAIVKGHQCEVKSS